MKLLKMIVFSFFALLLVTVRANPLQNSVVYNVEEREAPCVQQGGLCMRFSDCPPDKLVVHMLADLCPKQVHLGVTCCYL